MTNNFITEQHIFQHLPRTNVVHNQITFTIDWFFIDYNTNVQYAATQIPTNNIAWFVVGLVSFQRFLKESIFLILLWLKSILVKVELVSSAFLKESTFSIPLAKRLRWVKVEFVFNAFAKESIFLISSWVSLQHKR